MTDNKKCFVGFDTSNYTTSIAVADENGQIVANLKAPLPVKSGERGLRQSDAVFAHVKNLPSLTDELSAFLADYEPVAVGVSVTPRRAEGSYMPCFLAGKGAARMLAVSHGIPLFETSHQTGHILAALYSADCLFWLNPQAPAFLAFHVSGGTTDCVRCTPDPAQILRIEPVSASLDLKAGQAIDRVGLTLGLRFPCGQALEQLALQSDSKAHMQVKLRNGCCSLSGLQNQCEQMLKRGEAAPDIARYCLNSVAAVIRAMTKAAAEPHSRVLYAGGVMSDRLIQNQLRTLPCESAFAEPSFSCDNAAGVAIFAARRTSECQS